MNENKNKRNKNNALRFGTEAQATTHFRLGVNTDLRAGFTVYVDYDMNGVVPDYSIVTVESADVADSACVTGLEYNTGFGTDAICLAWANDLVD